MIQGRRLFALVNMIFSAYVPPIYELYFIIDGASMLQVEIETVWRFRRENSPQTVAVMIDVLNEIRKTGKISSAATDAPATVAKDYPQRWRILPICSCSTSCCPK